MQVCMHAFALGFCYVLWYPGERLVRMRSHWCYMMLSRWRICALERRCASDHSGDCRYSGVIEVLRWCYSGDRVVYMLSHWCLCARRERRCATNNNNIFQLQASNFAPRNSDLHLSRRAGCTGSVWYTKVGADFKKYVFWLIQRWFYASDDRRDAWDTCIAWQSEYHDTT